MIHANRIVTVGEQESIIDRPIVLYRGDREVEIEFTLVGNEFMFSEEGNVIKSVNASHGQLVLNTPSGEHMFSELAECHEGKVVFVVTKEMIDEFIEMGFYSFQIRLYDSAEMKSRVTIPPVMNGFDIRNPIAAEDETNVVDQGIVDYARIFKDQSNEELPTFTWDGEYVKTEWAHHDVITENKMNKIEDAIYSINANIKESDVVMLNALDNVKKDADKYVKEHMAEVEADVEDFERNLNTDVQQFKIDTNADIQQFKIDTNAAMTAHKNEVSEVVGEIQAKNEELNNILNTHIHDSMITVDNNEDLINAISDNTHDTIDLKKGTYIIDIPVTVKCKILGNGSTINVTSTITTSSKCKLYDINFMGSQNQIDCLSLTGRPIIEGCGFSGFYNAIFQTGITVHGLIKRNTFQYNRNGIYLQNAGSNSANNLTIENNYFVKHGTSADDLTANSTEPTFPDSLDTSAQGTGLDDIVGVGLICKSGCNGVFVHNNVFEYNSFCGVLVYQCNGNKTNDVKITSNYFEGNKTSGIVMVNTSSIGKLMQTDVHDNFYARIDGQNSDFYSHDLKCIGHHNSTHKFVNRLGYQPLWHPVDEEAALVYGAHVVRERNGREYYDLVVGTSKQYFQLPNGNYTQPIDASYEPVPFIFEYKVKLNSTLHFCDGTKTANAVMKAFEAGEYYGMEIVPGWINSIKYINRALEADEYFRIYQMYPISMLL